jgi:hypothetical protein
MRTFRRYTATLAFFATSVWSFTATAQCNLAWDDQFAPPGLYPPSGNAAVVFDSGNGPELYVGGGYFRIAGLNIRGLGKFDGTSWSSVGGVQQ